MTDSTAALPESIECPLCLGKGVLSRTEVLERLGMKDYARVTQLSAEEAIRLLAAKDKDAEQARWAKFDSELARQIAEVRGKHNAELQRLQAEKSELAARLKGLEKTASATLDNARQEERLAAEKDLQKQLAALTRRIAELEAAQRLVHEQKQAEVMKVKAELEAALYAEKAKANDLGRQVKDYFQEIGSLRERNQELEAEMAKVARVGKKEEMDFAKEARSWPGIWVGEKLPRNGDYLMPFADAAGNALEPTMVIDNKDKATVAEADIRKLVRDAKERKLAIAALVTREDSQLRHVDGQHRWDLEEGVWLLRTVRAWLPRDLEVLRPVFERMRAEGPDFLQRNAALADEVRRTLADIDEIEGQLKKAGTAIEKAQALTAIYRARLAGLCDTAAGQGMPGKREGKDGRGSAGNGNGTLEHQQANQAGGAMSHQHFCHVVGHYWECDGTALRGGTEPTVCICAPCGRPLEGFDHSKCPDPVELVACPEHTEEERRSIEEARKRYRRSAAEPGSEEGDAAPAKAEEGAEPLAEMAFPNEAARPFERFPLVPIEKGDPLWHCDWCCHCGCRRMPPELSGGMCLHCGHVYQRHDPEFWRGEEFLHSEAAHLKNCANYQEYAKKAEEGLAKFHAMIKGADDETFAKLLSACYSKAIDDNYEAYMSAPEGSPERAAIAEKIALAHAKETGARDEASGLPDRLQQEIRSGQVLPVAPPSGTHTAKERLQKG